MREFKTALIIVSLVAVIGGYGVKQVKGFADNAAANLTAALRVSR